MGNIGNRVTFFNTPRDQATEAQEFLRHRETRGAVEIPLANHRLQPRQHTPAVTAGTGPLPVEDWGRPLLLFHALIPPYGSARHS